MLERLLKRGVKAIRLGQPARVQENVRKASLQCKIEEHADYKKLEQCRREYSSQKIALRRATGRAKGMGHARMGKIVGEMKRLEFAIQQEIVRNTEVICSTLVNAGSDILKPFS
eukprot:UN33284